MPPEPLPWDRRDFRKHERSGSDSRLGGGGGPHRWREQNHHPNAPPPTHGTPYHHHNQQRWYSDFRSSRPLPPGHGKQGGWHMYADEGGNGFLPFGSRYGDRNIEDENFRPYGSRSDGRYFRNNRENSRASFSQKEWKAPSWEPAGPLNGPGRPTAEVNPRSTEKTPTHQNSNTSKNNEPTPPPPDAVDLVDQCESLPEEQNDKSGGTADALASTGQKLETANGLEPTDWKPFKWPRSGSFSSRVSRSSSSKSVGVDSVKTSMEPPANNLIPIQSPSTEAAAVTLSAADAPSEETSARKKPRLGWGEGLAKYEKKKVEGPEDVAMKSEMAISADNVETSQVLAINLLDKSPRVASLSDCASPATPYSVACSSSPGIGEKESVKGANVDHDRNNLSCSPSMVSPNLYDGPILNLENLQLSSIGNLSSLINELLQADEPSSSETSYVRNSSVNKLLVWKAEILKALEVTETEIDSLDTELKSLIAQSTTFCPVTASSSSLPEEYAPKVCEEQAISSNITIRPALLQVVSSGDLVVENKPVTLEDEHLQMKREDFDSPGSATSKFTDVRSAREDIFPSEDVETAAGFVNMDDLDEKWPENGPSVEENVGPAGNTKLVLGNNYQNLTSVSNLYYDCRSIYYSMLASNKDSANLAVKELYKLLPTIKSLSDSSVSKVSSPQVDSSLITEKFLRRKRVLKFKEKVITLKYKVFQHFWREGQVVSVKKLRMKSHKKFDFVRVIHKKNRSSSRPRLSISAGSPRTVPVDEVIEFINALLSDAAVKPCRSTLKMPALILDRKTMMMSRFISTNGLVEDPCAIERERDLINPWTSEEREIFIDKLATLGKDFSKIASFLPHKTVADCIEFYYKNHKSECFERARKKPEFMKQRKATTYLVASGKRWNPEANSTSLDILGAASEIAANVDDGVEIQQKSASRFFFGASSSYRTPKADNVPFQRSSSLDMYSNDRETIAADVLAGICGSLSSEAMSSCITSSVDPGDGYQEWRGQRVGPSTKRPLTPEVTQNIDECSDESCGEMDPTDWTDEEKSLFMEAVSSYGKDFGMISQCIGTRSREQCKLFFSKARKCLRLDRIQHGVGRDGFGDVSGGGSDSEQACIIQPGSIICNEASGSKMEEEFQPSMKLSNESDISVTQRSNPDLKICDESNRSDVLDGILTEPTSEDPLMGHTQVDDKPAMELEVDCRDQNGAVDACASVQVPGIMTVSVSTDPVLAEEENGGSHLGLLSENNALTVVSDGNHGVTDNLDKEVEDRDVNSNEASGASCGINDGKFDFHPSANAQSVQVHNLPACENKPNLHKCLTEKSNATPLQQKGPLESTESSTLFSVPIKYQKNPNRDILSAAVGYRNSDKHAPKIVRNGDCQLHGLGYASNTVESSQVLRGYPVSLPTIKEINGDVSCKKPVSFSNVSVWNGIFHSDRHKDFSLQKCNGSRLQSNGVEASFPFQEQIRECYTPQSVGSCDVEKPSRNGDVKLFGKILTSSQQKPNSCTERVDANNSQNHQYGGPSLNLKFGADQVSLDSSHSKFDCNNYLSSENIPIGSFGFWDGTRMQTGFPPLPDSTLLLTKYPAAFSGNYAIPTAKLDQPPTHVKIGDRPSNVVSIFSTSKQLSGGNGLTDYHQILRNREIQQPFTISEMQKRNGFGRGMSGINVNGRGGVLVGGQCSGVSDPVAAMKMHYAKAEQLSFQAGNFIKEDDAWRSNSS